MLTFKEFLNESVGKYKNFHPDLKHHDGKDALDRLTLQWHAEADKYTAISDKHSKIRDKMIEYVKMKMPDKKDSWHQPSAEVAANPAYINMKNEHDKLGKEAKAASTKAEQARGLLLNARKKYEGEGRKKEIKPEHRVGYGSSDGLMGRGYDKNSPSHEYTRTIKARLGEK
jgi:hypothetical protein